MGDRNRCDDVLHLSPSKAVVWDVVSAGLPGSGLADAAAASAGADWAIDGRYTATVRGGSIAGPSSTGGGGGGGVVVANRLAASIDRLAIRLAIAAAAIQSK